jgi:branched-chain amino acid transport system substrate-binding protein
LTQSGERARRYAAGEVTMRIAKTAVLAATALVLASCQPAPLKIGVPLVLTGVNSGIGVSGRNGVELAAKKINETGGIKGRRIELIVRDDGDDPDRALEADKEMRSLGAQALVGHMTSKSGAKAVPWCNETRMLLISPTISSTDWSGKDDYFFRVIGSNDLQGRALAAEALRRGFRRALVFTESKNQSFTAAVSGAFASVFESGGGRVAATLSFTASDTLDHAALAKTAIGYKPDLVEFTASAYDLALFAQELAKAGARIPIFGPMWSMTEDLFIQGGKAVEGVVVAGTTDLASKSPAYLAFRVSYRASFGEEPSFGAVHGYEALMMLAVASRSADDLDSPGLRKAILATRNFQGLQTDFAMDASGDCARPYRLFEARGGAFVVIE